MSFRDFTFPDVVSKLGLRIATAELFSDVAPIEVPSDFVARLKAGVALALGADNEKARSEFVVAPILLEFGWLSKHRHAVHSGVEFNVDPAAGLNGFCDFLITRSPEVSLVTAPIVALAEAKNDNVNTGLGQCIAGMRAAWLFNEKQGAKATQVFGATTTGTAWRFLRLQDTELALDAIEYHFSEVGKILAILLHMAATA